MTDIDDPLAQELVDTMARAAEKAVDPPQVNVEDPPRKIAMLGTAPSTRRLAPHGTDWEMWCQADYWQDLKRVDRWFEFAPMAKLQAQFPEYLAFLSKAAFPVFMRAKYEEVPNSREYPFEVMAENYGREFMTATLCWMMAQAITEHMEGKTIDSIGLWGYDLALDGEYSHQRPGVKHFEWVCRYYLPAKGFEPIEIYVPKGSDLTITPIPYPFAEDDPMVSKIRARRGDVNAKIEIVDRQINEVSAKLTELKESRSYLRGALEDLNYFERMACGVKSPAA